jgi:hypothetical protein
MRLTGWQRLSVVLFTLWVPVGFFWGNSQIQREHQWVYDNYTSCVLAWETVPNANVDSQCGTLEQTGQRYQREMSGHWIESIIFVLLPVPLVLLAWGVFLAARRAFRWVRAGFLDKVA